MRISRWLLAIAAAALALPASAAAAGEWTSSPDLKQLSLSWRTDDGLAVVDTAFKLTQPVTSAQTSLGEQCTTNGKGDPAQIQCPAGTPNAPAASSGTVTVTVASPVGCADSFEHAVRGPNDQTFTAQKPITPANACPPPPPPPESNEEPAGAPVAEPLLPLVVGSDSGGAPLVKAFDVTDLSLIHQFFAYAPSFAGGVRVAVGDVNGDGRGDLVTAAGPGGGPHVKVFDGVTGGLLHSFFADDPSLSGGLFVAAGDVNGDGRADIITGAGPGGGPHVKVFDGRDLTVLRSFLGYGAGFTGGVRVATGDVDGDGRADLVTGPGAGAPPQVKVFDGQSGALVGSFLAYDPGFAGGVFVAAGDVNRDGRADFITAPGSGAGPQVKVFDGGGGGTVRSFFSHAPSFTGGVRVAAGDVNRDGVADIVTVPGPGAPAQVKVFSGATGAVLRSFFAFDPSFGGGAFVGAATFRGAALRSRTIPLTAANRAVFRVACPAGTQGSCRGTLSLVLPAVKTPPKSSPRRRARRVILGRTRFRARPGRRARVVVRITRAGRRALGERPKVKARAQLTTRDAGGNVNAKHAPVVLKAVRRR